MGPYSYTVFSFATLGSVSESNPLNRAKLLHTEIWTVLQVAQVVASNPRCVVSLNCFKNFICPGQALLYGIHDEAMLIRSLLLVVKNKEDVSFIQSVLQ